MKNQKGVTMVEILAVMVILALLSVALYKGMSGPMTKSKQTTVESDMRVLKKAVDNYVIENNGFPDVTQLINNATDTTARNNFADKMSGYSDFALQVDTTNTSTSFFELETKLQKDPWGGKYYILFPKDNTQPVYIISNGADKTRATYSSGTFGDDLLIIVQKK